MKELSRETPETRSWIYSVLKKAGIRLPTAEGFSVKADKVTALFERLKSTVDIEKWSELQISAWIQEKDSRDDWLDRCLLASSLKVPLYLILWQDKVDKFRILSVSLKHGAEIVIEDKEAISSCKALAEWLSVLKGIQVSKRFVEPGRLSSIDECLRKYGVPWPGNLDGFLVNEEKEVRAMFELSRTRKFPVQTHDINRYFSEDINRWKPLDILRRQMDIAFYILIWSSDEEIVKIHSLRNVANTGLEYSRTELLKKDQLAFWFRCA